MLTLKIFPFTILDSKNQALCSQLHESRKLFTFIIRIVTSVSGSVNDMIAELQPQICGRDLLLRHIVTE